MPVVRQITLGYGMVFSSLVFLFIFLPLFLAVYYLTPAGYRNYTALAGSCFFYAWGAPRFIFILGFMCFLNYLFGRAIFTVKKDFPSKRRRLLAVSLVLNLGVLFYFKYSHFFILQVNLILSTAGMKPVPWSNIMLPLGISFFTFHMISYLVDIYRGVVAPADRFTDYFLYIVFFPKLISGPIVRYHDIADQIRGREFVSSSFVSGLLRFCSGLGKKVLIANVLGELADKAFDLKAADLSMSSAWLGILCYTLQIYFDFSGYSDMAIGLGRMLGFQFLENFNFPYISKNFTEFWKRWHISLSNFMREYLYIPLGGNRVPGWRIFVNLWAVFLVSGFWHGAGWNFIVWGAYHGFFLSLDRLMPAAWTERIPRLIAAPVNFVLVMFSWVFFRSENLGHAIDYISHMLGFRILPGAVAAGQFIRPHDTLVIIVALAAVFIPAIPGMEDWLNTAEKHRQKPLGYIIQFSCAVILFGLSVSTLVVGGFNPFIYFRF